MPEASVSKQTPKSLRSTITNILRALTVGEVAEWDRLAKACGIDRSSQLIYIATKGSLKVLQKEGLRFITRRGIGIERIDHDQVVHELLPKHTRGLTRAAKKLRHEVEATDVLKVKPENRPQLVGYGYIAALTEAATTPKAVKRLASSQPDLTQIGAQYLQALTGADTTTKE